MYDVLMYLLLMYLRPTYVHIWCMMYVCICNSCIWDQRMYIFDVWCTYVFVTHVSEINIRLYLTGARLVTGLCYTRWAETWIDGFSPNFSPSWVEGSTPGINCIIINLHFGREVFGYIFILGLLTKYHSNVKLKIYVHTWPFGQQLVCFYN
jgi:hypothetical protein